MIQIAVLGYGTVGSGVVEVINTNHDSINKRAENEINIKYVLDLRDFPGDPVEKVLVHDYEVIANDPEVDIVVEVMGGVEPGLHLHKTCAGGWKERLHIQQRTGGKTRYRASCNCKRARRKLSV